MILVSGMPRSGTSLLCSILEDLGFDFQADVPPDDFNPDGYWEREDVVELDQHLMGLTGGWNVLPGFKPLKNVNRWRPHTDAILAEVSAVKVPRAAFFREVWDRPEASWIISVRHPHEVALSWEKAYGHNRQETLDVWIRYHARFSDFPVGRSKFVSYSDWFRDPKSQLLGLARFLDVAADKRALARVKPSSRHYSEAIIEHPAQDLYDRLMRCAS